MGERGMSKKQQPEKPVQKPIEKPQASQIEYPKDASGKRIEPERFCKICWGRFKGYGTATHSSYQGTRYYRCDKVLPESEFGPCGFTWTMEWPEIVEKRERYIAEMQAVIVGARPVSIESLR